jgi:hypothetical protein
MNRILRFFPAIRVHSWGGLGSQLFTAYVVLKMQEKHPTRRIKVIVHTSGVTRRVSEFDFKCLGVTVNQVEDYRESIHQSLPTLVNKSLSSRFRKILKTYLLRILNKLRIIQNADSDKSFDLISPWTLILRGHYTRLTLERPLITLLFKKVFPEIAPLSSENFPFVIHYRLGDLLHLANKEPISPKRIETVLAKSKLDSDTCVVIADSDAKVVASYLEHTRVLGKCRIVKYDPLVTLWTCVQTPQFLGTTAKLSLWAAIFRHFVFDKESFLPDEFKWVCFPSINIKWY